MSLTSKKCIPCEDKNMKPFDAKEIEKLIGEISKWEVSHDKKKISKEFVFNDFVGALRFVNQVGDVAEAEGHHPDIHIVYNKVTLDLSTHSIGGLSENDFIVAAKIDALW